jgi:hypothetical protein
VDLGQSSPTGVLRALAVSSQGQVFVAARPGVLRSRKQLAFDRVGEDLDVAGVAIDLQDHVYAAIEPYEKSPSPLRVSLDGGDTWTATDVPAGRSVRWIAADPTAAGRVYVIGENDVGQARLFRSDDGGASFRAVSDWGGVLAVDGAGAIYLSRGDGIWRSDDEGVTFSVRSAELAGPSLSPRFLLTDPTNLGHLILGTQEGLFTSLDAGATWLRTDPATTASRCSVIYQNAARVPGSPDEIYMAVNAAGVYYSADNGVSWVARNQGLSGDCPSPFGIGVAATSDGPVVYTTVLGEGPDSVFAFLAK